MSDFTKTILFANPEKAIIKEMLINGADIGPGYFVTGVGETYPDVDLTADGEGSYGITLEHFLEDALDSLVWTPQKNIDDLYSDNALVRVALCGSGIEVWAFYIGSTGPVAAVPGLKTRANGGVLRANNYTATPTVGELKSAVEGTCAMITNYDVGHATEKRVVRCII